ncbi:AraC-like DNA-binding protein [Dyella sp. SG562]|uniref:helix-turn-helix domain-containing protein n=1 Tax=Dyella sp. SG562 TaxID=2587017 RepID=UPI00141EA5FD|nr:AraC family transcriptional regulator [Dyella sp. SG562]NII72368.1 AraC-like DNA-binding protein [Dyella sp. SG562]
MSAKAPEPRGVLHPRLPQGEFRHERRLPGAALAGLVEHYWFVAWDLRGLPPQTQETLPHPSVHLVEGRIHGVHQGRFVRVLEGRRQVFGIKFRPGGFRPFYAAEVAKLMDASMAAGDLFGADAHSYEAAIAAALEVDDMAAAAERMLMAHLPAPDATVDRVAALVADIAADRSITTVEQLCERSALNARALQRLFKNYVGIGPKWTINRYRLHEAIAQLQQGQSADWIELALSLGYFDQAHFIRDFRALVGCTPAQYARRLQSTG